MTLPAKAIVATFFLAGLAARASADGKPLAAPIVRTPGRPATAAAEPVRREVIVRIPPRQRLEREGGWVVLPRSADAALLTATSWRTAAEAPSPCRQRAEPGIAQFPASRWASWDVGWRMSDTYGIGCPYAGLSLTF